MAASSSAAVTPFHPSLREELASWFEKHGTNPLFEIECRIKDVKAAGFERVLEALKSHRGWTNTPQSCYSLDRMHATGVRETIVYTQSGPGPATFMKKVKGAELNVALPSGWEVRFQVATEQEASGDPSPVRTFRHKERIEFVHKNLFRFDLTRVKQGTTDEVARSADTTFEIEIEFCGHQRPESSKPEYLADSMCMKVADLVEQLSHAPQTGGTAKRQRAGTGGPLQEGDEVSVATNTEIMLEPSGHGVPPRYGGEMPSELVTRWLFSHLEPNGRAYIMSEPARIGDEHFPLFYFCGTVPAGSLTPRAAVS